MAIVFCPFRPKYCHRIVDGEKIKSPEQFDKIVGDHDTQNPTRARHCGERMTLNFEVAMVRLDQEFILWQ